MCDQALDSNGDTKGEQYAANHGRIPEIRLRFQFHAAATELELWETPFRYQSTAIELGLEL